MTSISSPQLNSKLPASPSKCAICRLYRFAPGSGPDRNDLPELQADSLNPLFINHPASLLSSVDLDSLSEEGGARDAASRVDAIFALQTVLSSVLRSSSFAPAERATILHENRASLIEQYRLRGGDLDHIMSQPFRSLDGLCPLEFEIKSWSPIWESSLSAPVGKSSTGMETIRFLIKHWKPHTYSVADNSDERNGTSEDRVRDQRIELVSLVRKSCLRRLNPFTCESAMANEDSTNTLFQRIVHLIWSESADTENDARNRSAIGCYNYRASVVYATYPVHSANVCSLSLSGHANEEVDFVTLISITNFAAQLRGSGSANPVAVTPHDIEEVISNVRRRIAAVQRHQFDELRHHPYTRRTSEINSQSSKPYGSAASSNSPTPAKTAKQSLFVLPRVLLVEFIAAHRAWTLAIGRDTLELSVHALDELSKSSSESSGTDARLDSEKTVYAEMRLVPPSSPPSHLEGEVSEHVFTFPTMHITTDSFSDKTIPAGAADTVHISPCFLPGCEGEAAQGDMKPPVSRFDDVRLLNAGEMLLELRIRIRSSQLETSHSQAEYACLARDPAVGHIDTASESEISSAWSAISAPSKSVTSSGVVLDKGSDIISHTPSTLISNSADSS